MPVGLQLWDWLNWLFKNKYIYYFVILTQSVFVSIMTDEGLHWYLFLVHGRERKKRFMVWYCNNISPASFILTVVHLLYFKTINCSVCAVCKSDFEALDVHSNIETCREEFLTFFRADILGGSSCNKPLSDSERPEPSWGGAHRASQVGAAGAEPRGGCLVFLSFCHPVIGVRTHRTAVVTPSRHTGRASSGASIISPGFLV